MRLDNGRNYVLYGDFATGEGFSQQLGGTGVGSIKMRNLGQYNRSMTGIRTHREDEKGFLDGFVMRDSLRQAIEEYRGNGTSGPYAIANLNAVENSEKRLSFSESDSPKYLSLKSDSERDRVPGFIKYAASSVSKTIPSIGLQ